MKRRVLLYTRFERFWHWIQTVLILLLALTGFEVHGVFSLLGFGSAVTLHDTLAWSLLVLIAFAVFWHLTTGEWKQYVPTLEKMGAMFRFYTRDIFRGVPHPVRKTRAAKLNPLQRLTYFGLKVVIIPVQVASGLLYLYYDNWREWGIAGRVEHVALIHTAGAFAFLTFLVAYVYLTTTGETPSANIRAMITGYEALEEESATV